MNIQKIIDRVEKNAEQTEVDRLALLEYIGNYADEHGSAHTAELAGIPVPSFRTYLRPELRRFSALSAARAAKKLQKNDRK